MPEASQHPLSDAELTALEACLHAIGGRAPDMEYVDGLFCALLCGPVEVAPQVWLDWLFGELPAGGALRIEANPTVDGDEEVALEDAAMEFGAD